MHVCHCLCPHAHPAQDPQYLAALLRRSDPKEVDLMVDIITQRLYSNHYKARHTPYP